MVHQPVSPALPMACVISLCCYNLTHHAGGLQLQLPHLWYKGGWATTLPRPTTSCNIATGAHQLDVEFTLVKIGMDMLIVVQVHLLVRAPATVSPPNRTSRRVVARQDSIPQDENSTHTGASRPLLHTANAGPPHLTCTHWASRKQQCFLQEHMVHSCTGWYTAVRAGGNCSQRPPWLPSSLNNKPTGPAHQLQHQLQHHGVYVCTAAVHSCLHRVVAAVASTTGRSLPPLPLDCWRRFTTTDRQHCLKMLCMHACMRMHNATSSLVLAAQPTPNMRPGSTYEPSWAGHALPYLSTLHPHPQPA